MPWRPKTNQPPGFAPKGYGILFGLFLREMPKSLQVRLEPEPKRVAYIPWSALDSWGPMPSGIPAHYWFVVSDSWLEKAKVRPLSYSHFEFLSDAVARREHVLITSPAPPIVSTRDTCVCGHEASQHAQGNLDGGDCRVPGCECLVFDRKPRQGDLFVKREGEW